MSIEFVVAMLCGACVFLSVLTGTLLARIKILENWRKGISDVCETAAKAN